MVREAEAKVAEKKEEARLQKMQDEMNKGVRRGVPKVDTGMGARKPVDGMGARKPAVASSNINPRAPGIRNNPSARIGVNPVGKREEQKKPSVVNARDIGRRVVN